MRIANSKKFEGTVLARQLLETENWLPEQREECMKTLCKLYQVSYEELQRSQTQNPWAKLCMEIIADVFPGYNQREQRGRHKQRPKSYSLHIYEMYEIAKSLTQNETGKRSRLGQRHLEGKLAKFESERLKTEVTPAMIHNVIAEGRALAESKQARELGDIFTKGVSNEEAYNAEDALLFLYSLAKMERTRDLMPLEDRRPKELYAQPLGKRRKSDKNSF